MVISRKTDIETEENIDISIMYTTFSDYKSVIVPFSGPSRMYTQDDHQQAAIRVTWKGRIQ